jgi:DNA-binding MltR family transcriptional regulator
MKKTKETAPPPEVAALQDALARFTRQADRGTALIATAWVDDCLKACVRAFFRPDNRVANDMLQPEGALGTFASRIKLAYLLDIIDPTAYRDLELLRRIRNEFAHRRSDLRFSSAPIKDRCREFHAIKACKLGGWPLTSPKHQVLVTSFFLSQYLLDLAKPRRRNPLLDHSDAYGSWIRRTVKSRSIALAAEVAGVA